MLQNLQEDNHRAVVQKIIELARDLDVISVAEGVEYSQELDFLRARGAVSVPGRLQATAMLFGTAWRRQSPLRVRQRFGKHYGFVSSSLRSS
jgi:EAL domain-containing protein (putative c-di-GMP-specific phosphodiesterase class I)